MKQFVCFAVAALIASHAAVAQTKSASAQIDRGREIFEKSTKGTPCATCHKMGGLGTAVGPDLKNLCSAVGPRAIAQSIEMSLTAYVQEVKTADATFPAFVQQKQGDETALWDLSQTPPTLKKLASKDIVSMANNTTWKHPPTAAGYTSQELADLVAFLKNAATGTRKAVATSDVESSE